MKKRATNSTAPVIAIAALVFLLLIAGCTTNTPVAEPIVITSAMTAQTTGHHHGGCPGYHDGVNYYDR